MQRLRRSCRHYRQFYFAANAINNLHALGLINGYGDGTFKPNQVITSAEAPDANTSREEAVVLVLRTLGKALELDLKL
ncbi:S-layer homology domain-containing protein [Paenibacillus catalpae]|uniref:S-layer homology domain-containing protein n=1 Tax=Paenibacillus catalpae TaxID=1045775 RepID=UPI000B87E988|nr:S-layer homology domain-containing protein [Paenibacillus catalpae]